VRGSEDMRSKVRQSEAQVRHSKGDEHGRYSGTQGYNKTNEGQ
jgi:hypothetical protein